MCSDTFDHTSLLRFVEAVFKVEIPRRDATTQTPGLSPWRESTTGDMTSAFNFAAAPDTAAPTLPMTNRADPRVLTECPAPTGTLASSDFSSGYPVPASAQMPTQETLPGPVKRPSGIDADCGRPRSPRAALLGAWALPVVAAGATAVAAFLRRRGRLTRADRPARARGERALLYSPPGEVSEWLKVPLSKSGVVNSHRGFESHPLRQCHAPGDMLDACP